MSFKRDGDDVCLLNRLRHKRVSELLGSHIPEDEAKLLSNGRLTCLVCTHRPIFDTTNMLSRHRQGKKHLFELNKYITKNEQLELYNLKKEHQKYLEDCKKNELSSNHAQLLGPKEHFSLRNCTSGKRRKVIDISEIKCNKLATSSCELKINSSSSSSQLRKYLKRLKRKPSLEKLLEKEKSNYSVCNANVSNTTLEKANDEDKIIINEIAVTNRTSMSQAKSDLSRNLSGWIKDIHGNWIKDPEAEFDTDDDEVGDKVKS